MPPGRRPSNQPKPPDIDYNHPSYYNQQQLNNALGQNYAVPNFTFPTPKPLPNYAIPGGNLTPPKNTNTFNAAAAAEVARRREMAERSREIADRNEARHAAGLSSAGIYSTDLDPNLMGGGTSAYMDELMGLLNQPDIPGHWESPYSQDYLNQLGDRLNQLGVDAQADYGALGNEIAGIYSQGIAGRNERASGLFNELAGNAQNIGVDYGTGSLGQQFMADREFLNETAGQNQATDLAYTGKLGEMTAQLASQLGMQARGGLLTPKTWIGPQSGMSEGEKMQAQFLMSQMEGDQARAFEREMAAQEYKRQLQQAQQEFYNERATGGGANSPFTMNQTGNETFEQKYPDLVGALGQIEDPRLRTEADRLWMLSGSDPVAALKLVSENYDMMPPEDSEFSYSTETDPVTGEVSYKYNPPVWGYGASGNPAADMRMQRQYEQQLERYNQFLAERQQEEEYGAALTEFFKRFSPGYGLSRTGVSMGNASSYKTP